MLFNQYKKCNENSSSLYSNEPDAKKCFLNFNMMKKGFSFSPKKATPQKQLTSQAKQQAIVESALQAEFVMKYRTPNKLQNFSEEKIESILRLPKIRSKSHSDNRAPQTNHNYSIIINQTSQPDIDVVQQIEPREFHISNFESQETPVVEQSDKLEINYKQQQQPLPPIDAVNKSLIYSSYLIHQQLQGKLEQGIQNICRVLFIDQIESLKDIKNSILSFDLRKCFLSCFKTKMKYIIDDDICELFLPIFSQLMQEQSIDQEISSLSLKQILKIKNKEDIYNYYSYCLEENFENRIEDIFRYYFVPIPEYRQQIIQDVLAELSKYLKKELNNRSLEVLSTQDGEVITDLFQLGWTPEILLVSTNQNIIQAKLEMIKHHFKKVEKIHHLQKFKQYILEKHIGNLDKNYYLTENLTSLLNNSLPPSNQRILYNSSKQLQERYLIEQQLKQKLVQAYIALIKKRKNQPPQYKTDNNKTKTFQFTQRQNKIERYHQLKQITTTRMNSITGITSIKRIIKKQTSVVNFQLKDVEALHQQNPEVSYSEFFVYFADFRSLKIISDTITKKEKQERFSLLKNELIASLEVFEHFALMFQLLSPQQRQHIYDALGVGQFSGFIKWKQFLTLRIIMDEKGTTEQNVDFIFNYFDQFKSGEVKETTFLYLVQSACERHEELQELLLNHNNQDQENTNIQTGGVHKLNPKKKIKKIEKMYEDFQEYLTENYPEFVEEYEANLLENSKQVQTIVKSRESISKQALEKHLKEIHELGSVDFTNRFTTSLWRWMTATQQIQNGIINKQNMTFQYQKNKYTFLSLINLLLGSYQDDAFTWVKDLI